jgi:hypothetical protein
VKRDAHEMNHIFSWPSPQNAIVFLDKCSDLFEVTKASRKIKGLTREVFYDAQYYRLPIVVWSNDGRVRGGPKPVRETSDRIDGSSRCRSIRVQDCDCVYVQSNACEYKEMGEERCTVSGRGVAGSASHVGDLRLGSDAKCSRGGGGASRHWLRSL